MINTLIEYNQIRLTYVCDNLLQLYVCILRFIEFKRKRKIFVVHVTYFVDSFDHVIGESNIVSDKNIIVFGLFFIFSRSLLHNVEKEKV
jgi:hypothetical protein